MAVSKKSPRMASLRLSMAQIFNGASVRLCLNAQFRMVYGGFCARNFSIKNFRLSVSGFQLYGNLNSFLTLRFNYEAVTKIISENLMIQKDLVCTGTSGRLPGRGN
ncbi:MAG: hypothetical protein IH595_10525 [Bacteroidales bacterium]|nr:hypothetical protein [Bacteroidales bacterium]